MVFMAVGWNRMGVKVPSHPNQSMTPDSARARVGQQEGPRRRLQISTQDAGLGRSTPRTELRGGQGAELSFSRCLGKMGRDGGAGGLSRALWLLSAQEHSEVFDHSWNKNWDFPSVGTFPSGELRAQLGDTAGDTASLSQTKESRRLHPSLGGSGCPSSYTPNIVVAPVPKPIGTLLHGSIGSGGGRCLMSPSSDRDCPLWAGDQPAAFPGIAAAL